MIQSEDLFQRKILDFVELRGSSLNHRIIGGQRQRQHSMGGREDAVAMIQYHSSHFLLERSGNNSLST